MAVALICNTVDFIVKVIGVSANGRVSLESEAMFGEEITSVAVSVLPRWCEGGGSYRIEAMRAIFMSKSLVRKSSLAS